MTIVRDEEYFAPGNRRMAERHRFSGGSGFVEERRICDVEPRKIDNHGLKVEERFEPALGKLSLVRRVGSIPPGVLENIALNQRRRDAIGVTGPDKRFRDSVFVRD